LDGSQFDSLTRLVGQGRTRRTTLRSALGGAAAAVAAAIGASAITGDVAAKKNKNNKCKDKKKKCEDKLKKCENKKKDKCEGLPAGAACQSNQQCCTNETNTICSVFSNDATTTRCCGGLGFHCTSDDQCCKSFKCKDGICQPAD
jgi:hypothetical protein